MIVINETSDSLEVKFFDLHETDTIINFMNQVASGDTLIDLNVDSDDDLFEPNVFYQSSYGIIRTSDTTYDINNSGDAGYNLFNPSVYEHQGNNIYLLTITDEDFD
jgi:hypothetical protein